MSRAWSLKKWVKDFNTIDFRIKDFYIIIKIRIPFHYFKAIPTYVAFYMCLQSAPCLYTLNSDKAPIPRRRRRQQAPPTASPPPDLLVPVYLPSYISPFLVFLVVHELGADDSQVRTEAPRYR